MPADQLTTPTSTPSPEVLTSAVRSVLVGAPLAETTATARIQVVLRAADGTRVLDRTVVVTPDVVYPNGPGCGGETPQVRLRITSTGDLQLR